MSIGRLAKTVAWATISLLTVALCWWIVAPMYSSDAVVTAYLRSDILLFLTACGILGSGVYIRMSYARRHPELRGDARFLIIMGAVLLFTVVVVILRFGGIQEENFNDTANAAVNLNLILTGVLPIPLLIRTLVLAFGVQKGRGQRTMAVLLAGAAVAFYVVLIATGQLLQTL